MLSRRHRFQPVVGLWAIAMLTACGGGGDVTPPPPQPSPATVASVTVALATTTVTAGQSTQATATLRAANGSELTGRTVEWTSSSSAVAAVTQSGAITTIAPGVTTITATSGGQSGSATLTVTAVPIATIRVTLAAVTLEVGQTTQGSATPLSASNAELTGRPIVWSSSSPAVATVTPSGLITAVALGTSTITAASEGQQGTAVVTVTPASVSTVSVTLAQSALTVGQSTQASATSRSATGVVLTGRAITWTSSNATVASVSPAGVITAIAPGTSTVTAAVEGKLGTAVLTVTLAPVSAVLFSTDSMDVPIRASEPLAVTLKDAGGNTLTGRTVTWQVAPANVATISATGLLRMTQPGTVTVTATSEGRSATLRVRGSLANLSAMVDSIRLAHGLPAMGGAIVSRDGLVGIGVAGSRRVTGGLPVTVDDKWHLGSNTKAITGVMAGLAVQDGVISWSTTVAAAFPDLSGVMRAEYRDVPLRELLSHTGGVINNTAGLPAETDARAARLAWASHSMQQPPQNARGVFYYSNNTFGIAGSMLERAWSIRYEDMFTQRIVTPLGLVNVGWGPTTSAGAMDQPIGHRRTGGAWVPCEGCDNRPGLSTAGTLHMPLRTWARLIQELLLADQGRSAILTQQTARFLTANQVPDGQPNRYGIGWHVSGPSANRFAVHDGSNTTNHSRAIMYLDGGVAFLIVTNAAELDVITPAAITAMQLRLDRYWQQGR